MNRLRIALSLAVLTLLAATPSASAQSLWTGGALPFSNSWNNGSNWSPGVPNSAAAAVTFNGSGLGTVTISTSVQTQSLTFANPTGAYTLTSAAGQSLSSLTNITINNGVTGLQTINLANVAAGSLLFTGSGPGALTIANNAAVTSGVSPTLVIGPATVIGTPGSGGITVTGTGTTTISGSFAAGGTGNNVVGGITKTGSGILTLSGNGTNLSGGLVLSGGLLVFNYSSSAAAKFGSGPLTLNGGTVVLDGTPGSPAVNDFAAGTTIGPGHTSLIWQTYGGGTAVPPVTMNFGALTRPSTGTLDVTIPALPGIAATTTTTLTNGILGGWATVGGDSWATKVGSRIAPLGVYGADVYSPGTNTDVTAGAGIPADFTTTSLRMNNGVTAVLSGSNSIESGGILARTGAASAITGGTLTSPSGQLTVHAYGPLTVDSAFSLPGGLVKAGTQPLILTGDLSGLTGPLFVNQGFVRLASQQALNTLGDVRFTFPADSGGLSFGLPAGQDGTLNAAVRLSSGTEGANIFLNNAQASRITLNGPISSAAGRTPVQFSSPAGSGFNLTGPNTFFGNVLVAGGTLGIAADASLGDSGNMVVLSGNGGLEFLTPSVTLAHPFMRLDGPGRVIVSGTNTNTIPSGISGVGSLTKQGTGILVLNGFLSHTGGTAVSEGRLVLEATARIPTGTNVTVDAGAEFNIGTQSNTAATAVGTILLTGGTFRVPSGSADYFVNRVAMTGGAVDFTGTSFFWLHFVNSGATITAAASSTTATWVGPAGSRIQNDTAAPLTISVTHGSSPSGIDLDIGAPLSSGGTNPNFQLTGGGTVRLSNPFNSGNLSLFTTTRVDDLTTNVGGALGIGTVLLSSARLQYGGPDATTTKNLTIQGNPAAIQVLNNGANLTYNGVITALGVEPLTVLGPGTGLGTSTLTLGTNNNYTGATVVAGNGVVAVSTIANNGVASSLGSGSVGVYLGDASSRGTLTVIGTNAAYSTNRTATLFGTYGNGGGGAIGVQSAVTNLTWAGPIQGAGSLIKSAPGMLTLTGASNNYTGGTFVEEGTLNVGASGAVMPTNSNVTVFAGGSFQIGFASGSNTINAALGTLALNGGTLRAAAGSSASYFINRLVSGAGGTVDFTGSTATLGFAGAGAGATINGNSTWSGGSVTSLAPTPPDITIAPNVVLTNSTFLFTGPFRITGGGTFYAQTPAYGVQAVSYVVSQARVRVDDLSVTNFHSVLGNANAGFFTLDGGTLQYSGSDQATPFPITLGQGGGTVEVSNAATTLTLTGPIAPNFGVAAGPLTKTGPGVLVLNNTANTYVGGITVSGGRLDVSDDAQLGAAVVAVNPAGTLRYTASQTTARTFNLAGGRLEAPAGVTLTLNGAAVNGGFLRGAGTFALTGGTVLSAVTSLNGTAVSVTGAGSLQNFTNAGSLTVAAGLAGPIVVDGFVNQGSGTMTIGAGSTVNAADFQSYGLITLTPGPSFAGRTQLTNAGRSPLAFNGGSRTFVGAPATAGNPTAAVDLNGNNAVVAGGLFVNNGIVFDNSNGSFTGPGRLVADFGALIKGAGSYVNTPVTQNGGRFQAGNSPGRAAHGSLVLGPGGLKNDTFQVNNARGAAGPTADASGLVSGWTQHEVVAQIASITTPGTFAWTADAVNKETVTLQTLLDPTPVGSDNFGLAANFDPHQSYSWPFVRWASSYTGPTSDADLVAATVFDASGFENPTGGGAFGWHLDEPGQTLFLTFTPTAVPEPGTLVLVGAAAFGWLARLRRPLARLRCRPAVSVA